MTCCYYSTCFIVITQVYHKAGSPATLGVLPHAGVHVVVMHPERGDVMLARQFLTNQPSEHRNLASCLASISSGRIVVVAAVVSSNEEIREYGDKKKKK